VGALTRAWFIASRMSEAATGSFFTSGSFFSQASTYREDASPNMYEPSFLLDHM